MAAQMYAGDNNDYLPQPGWGTSVPCWASGANPPLGGLPPTFEHYTNTLAKQMAAFRKGQLFAYLKNHRLLQCPADNVLNGLFYRRFIYFSSYV